MCCGARQRGPDSHHALKGWRVTDPEGLQHGPAFQTLPVGSLPRTSCYPLTSAKAEGAGQVTDVALCCAEGFFLPCLPGREPPKGAFTHIILSPHHSALGREHGYHPHLTDGKSKAQRSLATCRPRSRGSSGPGVPAPPGRVPGAPTPAGHRDWPRAELNRAPGGARWEVGLGDSSHARACRRWLGACWP